MSSLLFVPVSSTGKVKWRRKAIQKHVMNNYVAKQHRPPRRPKVTNDGYSTDTDLFDHKAVRIQDLSTQDSDDVSFQWPIGIGGGRLNPFIQYPVDVDMETLGLLDYGMSDFLPVYRIQQMTHPYSPNVKRSCNDTISRHMVTAQSE